MFKRRILTGKSGNSGFEDIHHSCTVRFLDESDPLTVTFQNDTRGQYLIDHVCSSLDLVEKDYFGLRYVDKEKHRYWIDPLKLAHKQLKDVSPPILSFRVKYYPSDPGRVKEDITRYYLFLQLVRDLHRGRLLCSPDQVIQMSAYVLQAEFGDYEVEFPNDYVAQAKMVFKLIQGHEGEVIERHKALRGKTPAEIEILFLDAASKLDTYGVDPHPIKDVSGASMCLGVTHQGIATIQKEAKVDLFKWKQIDKLDFEGKHFIVILTAAEKKQKHDYKCPTAVACKSLWKHAVEQRYFFTLSSSYTAPKVKAGRGLFRRGSSYRFRGHCQSEVFAQSAVIDRDAPIFTRWASNPQFFRTSGSLGTGSLPNEFRSVSLTEENIVAFENSQSDNSALDLIRNSRHAEDFLGPNTSSPVKSPSSILENAPLLTLESPLTAGGVFLNHLSTPLPPVEEGSGTPETPGTADDPKLLPEEPEVSAQLESLPPQPEKRKEAPESLEDGPEASGEAFHDASATPVVPVQVSGVSRRSRRVKVFVFVGVLVLALIFVLFETESLTPLLSLVHLESLWSDLRFKYYVPVRRLISFW